MAEMYLNIKRGISDGNPYSREMAERTNGKGEFIKEYSIPVDAHDFSGHPDGDIVHIFLDKDYSLTFYNKSENKYGKVIAEKGEAYVDGSLITKEPLHTVSKPIQIEPNPEVTEDEIEL